MDENNEKWIKLQEKVKKVDSEMANIIGVNISIATFTLKSPESVKFEVSGGKKEFKFRYWRKLIES